MNLPAVAPALSLTCLVTAALAVAELTPGASGVALVRLGPGGIAVLLSDPALGSVQVVGTPAPGYALLRGDVRRIRASLGQAVAGSHGGLCVFQP